MARIQDLTLRDRLSRLTYTAATRLLGEDGRALLRAGGRWDVPVELVELDDVRMRVELPGAVVTVSLDDTAPRHLLSACTACGQTCEHVGAVLALVLEEKLALGLAAPPRERMPVESLGEQELVARALADREERAQTEKMTLRSSDPSRPWTDYRVTSHASGKSYRLALRGLERGMSFCSCPDFRKNTLGTCKHVMHGLRKLRRRFSAADLARPYRRRHFALHLRYGKDTELRLLQPAKLEKGVERIVAPLTGKAITDLDDLLVRLGKLEERGLAVRVYPDAAEFLDHRLLERRLRLKAAAIRRDPGRHRLLKDLLKVDLLPYQLDGIGFAVGAGRAILADDMGLGKTIQAIGVAELLAREAGIRKVLVVCPASVKAQWRAEIERFSDRTVRVVLGSAAERRAMYGGDPFFTVCNYEQVLRDILAVECVAWDLIVLDEGQRIKNWETRTSRVLKGLHSPFALVLSGTPLENRLEELYSVAEFVDDRRLAPAFRFLNRHRVVDERGKVLGYKNLAELRRRLAPILLRRTRAEVLAQLPPRTTEIRRVPATEEQLDLHDAQMRIVKSIVNKRYISEMDLLRLQKALLIARMAANGTYLVDKQEPGYSSKLDELDALLGALLAEEGRKILLFSEWTTMLDLIEPLAGGNGSGWVRLDGSVPQKRRQRIVDTFREDPACKLFLATNAGATGLNLQVANTVINVDLPWNPAVLEQRIGRAHRMGQKRPVHVILLVTEETIEERMLATIAAKSALFAAAVDARSDVDTVDLSSGVEELRRRLEVLLGRKPEAPVDASGLAAASRAVDRAGRGAEIAAAGGRLVDAAFAFLGEMLPDAPETGATRVAAARIRARLGECAGQDDAGRPTLEVTLPDPAALDRLAGALARILGPELARPGAGGPPSSRPDRTSAGACP